MDKLMSRRMTLAIAIAVMAVTGLSDSETNAQRRKSPVQHLSVCGNPTVPCKTTGTFEPYNLPFRLPQKAVIFDTELFYAVILKSVAAPNDECELFVPEAERLEAQALFRDHKVFTSRCIEAGEISYSNSSPRAHFMAVYAGLTQAEANQMLAAVKATGKYPGANVRRMRAMLNGT
jgi:hypothetical protein